MTPKISVSCAKMKKRMQSYFSAFLVILSSCLPVFRSLGEIFPEIPISSPKNQKKKEKKSTLAYFLFFSVPLVHIFIFSYWALGEIILEIPISSPPQKVNLL